ncbi:MAG: PilT/PilU family type 4a pilus ATPase [Bdellovibrionota bacterium]
MYTIEQLLQFMQQNDASDLYLTVDRAPSFKVNGSVRPAGKQPLTGEMLTDLARGVLNNQQWLELHEKKELNLAICMAPTGRFRFNFYFQKNCLAAVVRKIETNIKTLDDLSLPKVLRDISMTKRGLVLVVGATGSGKSTSLAAMINHRNENEAGHIMTIEDPIEFVHEHKKCVVSQREVGVDTDSFKTALKNTLRQAPTVILIGEIRDEETMEHAINFAETGHLCLATLHSNNANQALERVINFFPPERHRQIYLQLSLNLRAIVSQRLVKTVDGGRAAAIEILLGSSRVRDLMKKGEVDALKEAMMNGSTDGMQTFDQALFQLYMQKRISLQEALENADSVTDLKLKIKLAETANGSSSALDTSPLTMEQSEPQAMALS